MATESTTYRPQLWFLLSLLLFSVVVRLLPYAITDPQTQTYLWGFTPLFAIALFGGKFFQDRRWAFAIPLGTYLLGDVAIGIVFGHPEWAIYKNQPIVYGTVAAIVLIGILLRRYRSGWAVAAAGVSGGTLFYLATNFGVWATGDGSIYPHSWEGLTACYLAGIPHYRNLLVSTLLFSGILFSPIGMRALEAAETELPAPTDGKRERVAVRA